MDPRYLMAHQTAETLQLDVESIYDPANEIFGSRRFEAGELHEWFRQQRGAS